jgi:hypothetical protein
LHLFLCAVFALPIEIMLMNDILKLWTTSYSVNGGNCESDLHQAARFFNKFLLCGKLVGLFRENVDSELKQTELFGTLESDVF